MYKDTLFSIFRKSKAIVALCSVFLLLGTAPSHLQAQSQNSEYLKFLGKIEEINASENSEFRKLKNYQEALRYAKSLRDQNLISHLLKSLLNHHYANYQYDSTYFYALQLLKVAANEDFEIFAMERLGDSHWYRGHYDSAYKYYKEAHQVALRAGNLQKQASLLRDIADYHRQTGNYSEAYRNFQQSIAIYESMEDFAGLSTAYINFSLVFSSMGDFDKQLEHLLKALEYRQKADLMAQSGIIFQYIADVYLKINEPIQALEKSQQALSYCKKEGIKRYTLYATETVARSYLALDSLEKAKDYFKKAYALCQQIQEKRYLARIEKSFGDLARIENDFIASEQYYHSALAYYREIADPVFEGQSLIGLARLYFLTEQSDKAFEAMQKGADHASKFGNKTVLLEFYKLFVLHFKREENWKQASHYHEQIDSLNELIFNENRAKYLAVNQIIHDTNTQAYNNDLLKKDNQLQKVQIEQQNQQFIYGIAFIVFLIVTTIIIYVAYNKSQFNKKKIALQNKLLQQKNDEIAKINAQQLDLIHLVAHDLKSPLNKITGLSNILKLEGGLTPSQLKIVNMMEEVSEKSYQFIINLLEAQELEKKALQPQIESFDISGFLKEIGKDYKTSLEKKSLSLWIENRSEGLIITTDPELLKHIVQNILSNAIKFSPFGKNIFIEVWNDAHHLYFSIADEGPGFNEEDKLNLFSKFQKLSAQPTNDESSSGLGLYLVKMMCDTLHADIQLSESTKSNIGAQFIMKFPLALSTTLPN